MEEKKGGGEEMSDRSNYTLVPGTNLCKTSQIPQVEFRNDHSLFPTLHIIESSPSTYLNSLLSIATLTSVSQDIGGKGPKKIQLSSI